jgi:hypothetical protein
MPLATMPKRATVSSERAAFLAGVPNYHTIEQWNGRDLVHVSNLVWMQRGGIVRRPTIAGLGESGPEAVVPLSGSAGLGNVIINVNVAGNAHDPEGIAAAVERVVRQHWRRSAVV